MKVVDGKVQTKMSLAEFHKVDPDRVLERLLFHTSSAHLPYSLARTSENRYRGHDARVQRPGTSVTRQKITRGAPTPSLAVAGERGAAETMREDAPTLLKFAQDFAGKQFNLPGKSRHKIA